MREFWAWCCAGVCSLVFVLACVTLNLVHAVVAVVLLVPWVYRAAVLRQQRLTREGWR